LFLQELSVKLFEFSQLLAVLSGFWHPELGSSWSSTVVVIPKIFGKLLIFHGTLIPPTPQRLILPEGAFTHTTFFPSIQPKNGRLVVVLTSKGFHLLGRDPMHWSWYTTRLTARALERKQ